jgi:Helix-turn-helix domain
MSDGPYLTLGEAAALARCAAKTLQNLMLRGVLVEGVHYFRPRGRRPLFHQDALVAWIEGRDDDLVAIHRQPGQRIE